MLGWVVYKYSIPRPTSFLGLSLRRYHWDICTALQLTTFKPLYKLIRAERLSLRRYHWGICTLKLATFKPLYICLIMLTRQANLAEKFKTFLFV